MVRNNIKVCINDDILFIFYFLYNSNNQNITSYNISLTHDAIYFFSLLLTFTFCIDLIQTCIQYILEVDKKRKFMQW